MEFEYVKCNICGSDDTALLVTAQTKGLVDLSFNPYLNLVRCKKCSLVYVNPRPKLKSISEELYSKEYFDTQFKDAKYLHPEDIKERFTLITQLKKEGRLLDVGCATGVFLAHAKSRNWEVYGVDVSGYAIKTIQEKFAFNNLFVGELKDAPLERDYFDAVTVADVLEHIPDPATFLWEINQLVKNDGIAYIAVPNIEGVFFKMALSIARFNHKNYFNLPHHLYHFSPKTLRLLIEKAGLKIIKLKLSEWRVIEKGVKGIQKRAIALAANILREQDRIIIIAKRI